MYTNKIDAGVIPDNNIILTTDKLIEVIDKIKAEFKFFELEMAEVVEVHLDTNQNSFPKKTDGTPDYSYYGGVLARYQHSEYGEKIDNLQDFKMLNPNINTYPVAGEYVYACELENGNRYYFSPFNFFGSPSMNTKPNNSSLGYEKTLESAGNLTVVNSFSQPGEHKTGYYHRPIPYPRLLAEEGDVVVEGRFGNSIRLGSDILENGNNRNSSKILLHTGRPPVELTEELESAGLGKISPTSEDVNYYSTSTISIGTNNTTVYNPAFISTFEKFTDKPKSEILIDSSQIILNTKNFGNIGVWSSGDISIGAVGDTVIEIPQSGEIKLGGTKDLEPVVKGDELVKLLDGIIKVIADGATAFVNESASKTSISSGILTLPQTKNILSEKVKTI